MFRNALLQTRPTRLFTLISLDEMMCSGPRQLYFGEAQNPKQIKSHKPGVPESTRTGKLPVGSDKEKGGDIAVVCPLLQGYFFGKKSFFLAFDWPDFLYGQGYIATCCFCMFLIALDIVFFFR